MLGTYREQEQDKDMQQCYVFGYTNATLDVWLLSCTQNLNFIHIIQNIFTLNINCNFNCPLRKYSILLFWYKQLDLLRF